MKLFTILSLISAFFFLFSCKSTQKAGKIDQQSSSSITKKDNKRINSDLFIQALKAKITGNQDKATELFSAYIEKFPADDAAYYELARIYLQQNKNKEALELAKKASELDPDNKWYLLLLGGAYQQNILFDEAAETYETLIEKYPSDIEFYDELAISYLLADSPKKAIEVYDKLEKKYGINEDIVIKKQKIYQELGQTDDAIKEIEKLIEKSPRETRYYAILAELCMSNEMYDQAYEAYQKILELDPSNPYIHISLSDYYRKTGDREKSQKELEAGFANSQLDIDTKVNVLLSFYPMAEIYEGSRDQAFALAKILKETHPEDPKAYSIYADFLVQAEKYEEARTELRHVIALDSSRYVVWEQLLIIESELEDYKAMANEGQRAMELFPMQPLPHLFAGVAHYQLKNYDKAAIALQRGSELVVNNEKLNVQFNIYLGDTYNQLEKNEESDAAYEKVLEIEPDNDYVLNNYAYFLSLRNEKLDRAAEMAKRATELKPNSSSNQDTYGWVLYKKGDFEEAKKWLAKALENGGDSNSVILEHYGDVLFKLGDIDGAYDYWLKAKEAGNEHSEFLDEKIKKKQLIE